MSFNNFLRLYSKKYHSFFVVMGELLAKSSVFMI